MNSTTTTCSSFRAALASSSLVSVSPNCTSTWMLLPKKSSLSSSSSSSAVSLAIPNRRRRSVVSCEVAVEVSSSSKGEVDDAVSKVGKRVRVTVPLKVYHVPKAPEIDLSGMEGQIKQYVGIWNGKRISANLPYKVEFFTEVEGRGTVKFVAHLREDEFEYI